MQTASPIELIAIKASFLSYSFLNIATLKSEHDIWLMRDPFWKCERKKINRFKRRRDLLKFEGARSNKTHLMEKVLLLIMLNLGGGAIVPPPPWNRRLWVDWSYWWGEHWTGHEIVVGSIFQHYECRIKLRWEKEKRGNFHVLFDSHLIGLHLINVNPFSAKKYMFWVMEFLGKVDWFD